MPELPEVETIRKIVERELTGRTLTGLELTLPKLVRDSLASTWSCSWAGPCWAPIVTVLITHWSDD